MAGERGRELSFFSWAAPWVFFCVGRWGLDTGLAGGLRATLVCVAWAGIWMTFWRGGDSKVRARFVRIPVPRVFSAGGLGRL